MTSTSASYVSRSVTTRRASGSIETISSCRNRTPRFARPLYGTRIASADVLPNSRSSLEYPKTNASALSISVQSRSSPTASDSCEASSNPPNPAPRMTIRIEPAYAVRRGRGRSVDRVGLDGSVDRCRLRMRRERRRLHLVCFAPPELLGEPRSPHLRSGLGVLQERVEPVVLGLVAVRQRIVWPNQSLVDAIRLIASHHAGIGTMGETLIYLQILEVARSPTPGISWDAVDRKGCHEPDGHPEAGGLLDAGGVVAARGHADGLAARRRLLARTSRGCSPGMGGGRARGCRHRARDHGVQPGRRTERPRSLRRSGRGAPDPDRRLVDARLRTDLRAQRRRG